jgi:hypothetical protein
LNGGVFISVLLAVLFDRNGAFKWCFSGGAFNWCFFGGAFLIN